MKELMFNYNNLMSVCHACHADIHRQMFSHIKESVKANRQWIYQRLNGIDVNGKPAKFTQDEILTLKHAMEDLSKKMGSVSVSL